MRAPNYAPLDDALDAIAPHGIALGNGNFNHAPMVVETLCALGYPERVQPWLADYRERMRPRPTPVECVGDTDWQRALGQRQRFADWALFFANELEEDAWPVVLDRWTGRLAPGFCAAATHGVIRVGHAARALAERETANRRRELADALASWAASWQRLPEGDIGRLEPMPLPEALRKVPIVPREQRRPGNITAALAILEDFPPFLPVIGWFGGGPIAPQIAELTELFARVYLANVRDVPTAIAFIHAVTSPSALGNIVPHISEATARTLSRYAWQSCCGLYACYGSGGSAFAEDVEQCAKPPDELALQAVANGDEHVIKFTEACLTRHAVARSDAFLAAADHVAQVIPQRRPG